MNHLHLLGKKKELIKKEKVNVIDIIMVVNMILEELPIQNSADLNQDGEINVLDVIQIVNIILGN